MSTFLVDELKAVFDPRGGYWQPGGKFMPSIIAELGYVIETAPAEHRPAAQGRSSMSTSRSWSMRSAPSSRRAPSRPMPSRSHIFPEGAQLCSKCSTAAVVMMDGCMTCLNCGDSKCG